MFSKLRDTIGNVFVSWHESIIGYIMLTVVLTFGAIIGYVAKPMTKSHSHSELQLESYESDINTDITTMTSEVVELQYGQEIEVETLPKPTSIGDQPVILEGIDILFESPTEEVTAEDYTRTHEELCRWVQSAIDGFSTSKLYVSAYEQLSNGDWVFIDSRDKCKYVINYDGNGFPYNVEYYKPN